MYVKDIIYTKEGDNNGKDTFEFVNTYDTKDLTVSKTVTGSLGDKTKQFEFIITLTDGNGNPVRGTYTLEKDGVESNITFNRNGIATVWLSHGQSITIKDLPSGVHYVIEENDEVYTTRIKINDRVRSGKTAQGDLTDNADVAFTNTLDEAVKTDATTELEWLIPFFSLIGISMIPLAVKRHRTARRRRNTS
ncbi:MAG: hypothetical protein J1E36_01785 [Eubacterium sp.]|nr:hypothetical protein [Eubacterium sp.]